MPYIHFIKVILAWTAQDFYYLSNLFLWRIFLTQVHIFLIKLLSIFLLREPKETCWISIVLASKIYLLVLNLSVLWDKNQFSHNIREIQKYLCMFYIFLILLKMKVAFRFSLLLNAIWWRNKDDEEGKMKKESLCLVKVTYFPFLYCIALSSNELNLDTVLSAIVQVIFTTWFFSVHFYLMYIYVSMMTLCLLISSLLMSWYC